MSERELRQSPESASTRDEASSSSAGSGAARESNSSIAQRAESTRSARAEAAPADTLMQQRSGGAALDGAGEGIASKLGVEATTVRVHSGAEQAGPLGAMGARAATIGSDVFMAPGQYDTSSQGGQHLLAHELTHVAQQSGAAAPGPQAKLEVGPTGDAFEHEAERSADAVVSGAAVPAPSRGAFSVQRAQRDLTSPGTAGPSAGPSGTRTASTGSTGATSTATGTVAPTSTGPSPEELAQLGAAAAVVPAEYRTAAGTLMTYTGDPLPAAPALAAFRNAIYDLLYRHVEGFEPFRLFMGLLPAARDAHKAAVTQLATTWTTDQPALTRLEGAITAFLGNGPAPAAAAGFAGAFATLSTQARRCLRGDSARISHVRGYDTGETAPVGAASGTPAGPRAAVRDAMVAQLSGGDASVTDAAATPETAAAPARTPAEEEAENTRLTTATTELREAVLAELAHGTRVTSATADLPTLSRDRLTNIRRLIDAAEPRVRDRIYADTALMTQMRETTSVEQMQDLLRRLDTSGDIVSRCITAFTEGGDRVPVGARSTRVMGILRPYCEEHAGTDGQPQRDRLMRDQHFHDEVLRELAGETRDQALRLIMTGRIEPSPLDRVQAACRAGNGADLARALTELASDATQMGALRTNLSFHQPLMTFSGTISIMGMDMRPYDFCRQAWGMATEAMEPGAEARTTEGNPNPDAAPVTPEEIVLVDEGVFDPTIADLHTALHPYVYVSDADVTHYLHRFQGWMSNPTWTQLARRAGWSPGARLLQRYEDTHSEGLRQLILSGVSGGGAREECERILGIRLDSATFGASPDAAAAPAVDPITGEPITPATVPIGLEQALREVQCTDGNPVTYHIHACAQLVKAEVDEMSDADLDDLRSAWNGLRSKVTDAKLDEIAALTHHGRPNLQALHIAAYEELGGSLSSDLASECDSDEAAEAARLFGVDAASAAARSHSGDVGAQRTELLTQAMHTNAQALFTALEQLRSVATGLDALPNLLEAARNPQPADMPARTAEMDPDPNLSQLLSDHYRTEFGVALPRHYGRIAERLASRPESSGGHTGTEILELMHAPPGASAAPSDAEITAALGELTVRDASAVAPGFTTEQAHENATAIFTELSRPHVEPHIIADRLEGYTREERRLIEAWFRSDHGVDLRYFIQANLARRPIVPRDPETGEVLSDNPADHIVGGEEEARRLLDVTSEAGRTSVSTRLRMACASDNMDGIYRIIEGATPADHALIRADAETMAALRNRADDDYEWDRVYRGLTGQLDLIDMVSSHAHGEHGIIGGMFDNTDEEGIRRDIRAYIRRRREALGAAVQSDPAFAASTPEQKDAELRRRMGDELARLFANRSLEQLIQDELSGAELSDMESMLMHGGEAAAEDAVLTGSDLTEDDTAIVTRLRTVAAGPTAAAELARLRSDPTFMRHLQDVLDDEDDLRDAMNILYGPAVPAGGTDHLAALDVASRDISGDINREEDDIVRNILALSEAELRTLQADTARVTQILAALSDDPRQMAAVRRVLAIRLEDTSAMDDDHRQQERLRVMKEMAKARVLGASEVSWNLTLRAAVDIYNMEIRPDRGADHPERAPSDAAAADAVLTATDLFEKAGPGSLRAATARHEVWNEVGRTVLTNLGRSGTGAPTGTEQLDYIRKGVLGIWDPSGARFLEQIGIDDDEEGMADAIRGASNDYLVQMWTTVQRANPPPGGTANDTLEAKYQAWVEARRTAGPAAAGPSTEPRDPATMDAVTRTRAAFSNQVIDVSHAFETLVLSHTGGLAADDAATTAADRSAHRVRDNHEYHDLKRIVRERIPTIPWDIIGAAIGANNDAEARPLLQCNARTAREGLEFAEEDVHFVRGRDVNSEASLSAGRAFGYEGEAEELDLALTDYRSEVRESTTAHDATDTAPAEAYGDVDDAEFTSIEGRRTEVERALTAFRAARSRVADMASAVVGVIIATIVTVLTAGAAGPLMIALAAAATAGASALAQQLVREAILAGDNEFSKDGLRAIGQETIMGAVTALGGYWARAALARISEARGVAAALASVSSAVDDMPSGMRFLVATGRAGLDEAADTTFEGMRDTLFEGVNPAHFVHGLNEGWGRSAEAMRGRLGDIPGAAFASFATGAMTHVVTHGAGEARRRLHGGAGGIEPGESLTDMMAPRTRTEHMRAQWGAIMENLADAPLESLSQLLVSEETYRASGLEGRRIAGVFAGDAIDSVTEAGTEYNRGLEMRVRRLRRGRELLHAHRGDMTDAEVNDYLTHVVSNDADALSVPQPDSWVAHFRAMGPGGHGVPPAHSAGSTGSTTDVHTRPATSTPVVAPGTDPAAAEASAPPAIPTIVPTAPTAGPEISTGASPTDSSTPTEAAAPTGTTSPTETGAPDAPTGATPVDTAAPAAPPPSAAELPTAPPDAAPPTAVVAPGPGPVAAPPIDATRPATPAAEVLPAPAPSTETTVVTDASVNAGDSGEMIGPPAPLRLPPGISPTTEITRIPGLTTEQQATLVAARDQWVANVQTLGPAPARAAWAAFLQQHGIAVDPSSLRAGTESPLHTTDVPAGTPPPSAPGDVAPGPTDGPVLSVRGAARHVPGTDIHGRAGTADPEGVRAAITTALGGDGVLPPGARVEGAGVVMTVPGPEGTSREVTVRFDTYDVTESHGPRPAVARFEMVGESAVVRVSSSARPGDVARALAHELGQLHAIVTQRLSGRPADATSALAEGSQSRTLTADDHGSIAELRVSLRQLQTLQANPAADPAEVSRVRMELQGLMIHLGLLDAGSGGPVPLRAPREGETWDRLAGEEAVNLRLGLIESSLGGDMAALRTALERARSTPEGRADVAALRARREEHRHQMREHAMEVADAIETRDAALTGNLTGAGAHVSHVFGRLIIGGGWAAVATFATMPGTGAADSGMPNVMAISHEGPAGAEPWLQRGALDLGQNPNELSVDGFTSQASDYAEDMDDFADSDTFGLAAQQTRDELGMPTYRRSATQIQERPAGGWPDLPAGHPAADARFRVVVGSGPTAQYLYTNGVDVAGGPGPQRTLPGVTIDPALERNADETTAAGGDATGVPRHRRVVYGDEQLLGRIPTGRVLVYGPGAAGAWNVEATARAPSRRASETDTGEITWAGPMSRFSVGDLPPGHPLTAPIMAEQASLRDIGNRIRELRGRMTGTPAGPALTALQAEMATLERSREASHGRLGALASDPTLDPNGDVMRALFAQGDLRRNNIPGGAFDPSVGARRVAREIRNIEPDGAGVRVTFTDGTVESFDQVVISIGQDSTATGGAASLLGQVGDLAPIRGPNGEILGAGNADESIRVMGAASTPGAIGSRMSDEAPASGGMSDRATHRVDSAVEADTLPTDSRGIQGAIRAFGRRIAAANAQLPGDGTATFSLGHGGVGSPPGGGGASDASASAATSTDPARTDTPTPPPAPASAVADRTAALISQADAETGPSPGPNPAPMSGGAAAEVDTSATASETVVAPRTADEVMAPIRDAIAAHAVHTDAEIRAMYLAAEAQFDALNTAWTAEGLTVEERARRLSALRHEAREGARALMQDRAAVERLRERDMQKYGHPDGPTFEQLIQKHLDAGLSFEQACAEIVGSAQRSDAATNSRYGLQGNASRSGDVAPVNTAAASSSTSTAPVSTPAEASTPAASTAADASITETGAPADASVTETSSQPPVSMTPAEARASGAQTRVDPALASESAAETAPDASATLGTIPRTRVAEPSNDTDLEAEAESEEAEGEDIINRAREAARRMGGTASAVPNSAFFGNNPFLSEEATAPDHQRRIYEIRPTEVERAARTAVGAAVCAGPEVTLTRADGQEVRVRIEIAEGDSEDVASHDYADGANFVTVRISSGARQGDVERAIAHELAEIRALMDGRSLDQDLLTRTGTAGAAEGELSAHDMGRLAELRVLFAQLTASSTSRSGDRAGINRSDSVSEIDALLDHLGLSRNAPGTEARIRAMLPAAEAEQLVREIRKLSFLSAGFESTTMDTTAGFNSGDGVAIYGWDTGLGNPPGASTLAPMPPGHIMGSTMGPVAEGSPRPHMSMAPDISEGNFQRVPNVDTARPFPGVTADLPASARAGELRTHEADTYTTDATSEPADFAHVFDSRFVRPAQFAAVVTAMRAVSRAQADYVLFTTRYRGPVPPGAQVEFRGRRVPVEEARDILTVQARNCVTEFLRLATQLQTQFGESVLDSTDMAMLGVNPDGTFMPGRDLRPQDLYQHLRFKEAEFLRLHPRADAAASTAASPSGGPDGADTEDGP